MGLARRFDVGAKFGRLTVLEFLGTDHANKRLVKCVCECGKIHVTRSNNLGRKTNSCGCLAADLMRQVRGKPIEDLAARHVLNACRRSAETTITQETVKSLIFSSCFYCERSPEEVGTKWSRARPDGRVVVRIGIDRVNPNKGYIPGNCVSCCQSCNFLKRDHDPKNLAFTLEKFLKNLKRIVDEPARP